MTIAPSVARTARRRRATWVAAPVSAPVPRLSSLTVTAAAVAGTAVVAVTAAFAAPLFF